MIKISQAKNSPAVPQSPLLEEIPKLRADLDQLQKAVDEIIAKRKLTADERRVKMRDYMKQRRAADKAKAAAAREQGESKGDG